MKNLATFLSVSSDYVDQFYLQWYDELRLDAMLTITIMLMLKSLKRFEMCLTFYDSMKFTHFYFISISYSFSFLDENNKMSYWWEKFFIIEYIFFSSLLSLYSHLQPLHCPSPWLDWRGKSEWDRDEKKERMKKFFNIKMSLW